MSDSKNWLHSNYSNATPPENIKLAQQKEHRLFLIIFLCIACTLVCAAVWTLQYHLGSYNYIAMFFMLISGLFLSYKSEGDELNVKGLIFWLIIEMVIIYFCNRMSVALSHNVSGDVLESFLFRASAYVKAIRSISEEFNQGMLQSSVMAIILFIIGLFFIAFKKNR